MLRPTLPIGFLAGGLAVFLAATSLALLPTTPAAAATPKQKAATCKFYADQQKLAGPKRAQFMAKCTSGKNDPRGRAVGAPGGAGPAKPEQEQQ